jgi:hypothetical protein
MMAERKRTGHRGSTTKKKEKGKERTGANEPETAFENGRKPDK